MSLRGQLLHAVRRITGSERVADRLTAHISNQTGDLIAHLNNRTAELLRHIRSSAEYGAGGELAELYGLVGRSLFRRLGYEGLKIDVQTDKPVAYDSPDHVMPWGTKQDNSTNLPFNLKLAQWIDPADLRVLDLGCSGGGFVRTVLAMGCLAVGIEGSDYSKVRGRAEWSTIPDYLFTADITEPFRVTGRRLGEEPRPLRFTVITAWEVIEHIHRDRLGRVLENIDAHLEPNGVAVMSVSPRPDVVNGVALHQTVEGPDWWLKLCERNGFVHHDAAVRYFRDDWIRSEPNAPQSFHLVLTRRSESLRAALPTLSRAAA